VIQTFARSSREKNRSGRHRSDVLKGGRYSGIPLTLTPRIVIGRHGFPHVVENFRALEDDVDAATLRTQRTRPQGFGKSRKEREIPTASTSLIFLYEENEERRTKPTQINCPPNRITPTGPFTAPKGARTLRSL
jgi:hypothetical protein